MKAVISTLLDQSIDPLTAKEERRLLFRAKRGDQAARNKLVQSLIRYGVKLSSKYSEKGMDEDDYAQLSVVGILEAIDTFDMTKKNRLSTHMHWRVRHTMTVAQMHGELIRVPSNKRRLNAPKFIMSLPDWFDTPEEGRDVVMEKDSLWFMPLLSPREQLIIQCRYFHKMTLNATGERIGVTRERIRQIVARIFWRVRYAEANSRSEKERTRLFFRARRPLSCIKKSRKKSLPSPGKQMVECVAN